MLPEISLNILDIAQNSIRAGASIIDISVIRDTEAGTLSLSIEDDGCGMDADTLERVTDPFYTSRSTRKVGLGIPFLKQAAEASEGSFSIRSVPGEGTRVEAVFCEDHIDCMPLGDITGTMLTLITGLDEREGDTAGERADIVYLYRVDAREFSLDTRELREALSGLPLSDPEVYGFLSDFFTENKKETDLNI